MVKLCPICQKIQIADNYSQCIACLNKTKELNSNEEICKKLEWINWNCGSIALLTRINLLFNIAKEMGDKELIEKIYNDLKRTYEKDISNIKKIKEESEK